jgi:alcohol dehydrogenase, propanol-preferring
MQAWALVDYKAPLRLIDLPTPEPTGTEVLLEVTHCGVCHSDLHLWDGFFDLGDGRRLSLADRGLKLPLVMGHEIVGRVVAVGPEANAVKPGDSRIVFPWLGCGRCAQCETEEDNLCQVPSAIGLVRSGGYGSHVMVPHSRHLVDYAPLDPALAATYACSGITVLAAIRKVMPMEPDEPLVVIGAGGLGRQALAVLAALGHRNIVAVDPDPAKREAALAAGARAALDGAAEDLPAQITAACGGPVRAVIDLVNGPSTVRAAFAVLARGGTLVHVGLFGGGFSVPLPVMAMRALSLRGSYVGNPKDLRALVALAREGRLEPVPVVRMRRDQVNEALTILREGRAEGRMVLEA